MSFSPCPDPVPGNAASVNAIETLIVPRAVDLGEMTVRRALPSTRRQMVGPFIFFDQMGPAEFLSEQGIDVRPHPHVNLATLTYLFDGEILHRDSLGTEETITPGDVNWMRAGRGIVHSERTGETRLRQGQRLSGIQSWVALPTDVEESDPQFVHHAEQALPLISSDGVRARLIAGSAFGQSSPLVTASETLYADLVLEPGARLQIEASHDERALYTVDGAVRVAGDDFEPHQLIVLRRGAAVVLEARERPARVMLFGGEPMGEARYIWWNFVSSRRERIEQARLEWAAGKFDSVPGDEGDFIPLPENAGDPKRAEGAVRYP